MADKKRIRINGTFRWAEQQARDLVTIVLENVKTNPEQFEKPTAQKFYERISENAPNLHHIKWDIMRTKMRHLKSSFLAALKWQSQTGAGLLENGYAQTVDEYIKKTCPFYNELHTIFGKRVNIQPPAIYQSTQPVSSLDNSEREVEVSLEIDCETSSTNSLQCPLASPSTLITPTLSEKQVSPSVVSDIQVSPHVTLSPTLSEDQVNLSCTCASIPSTQKQTTTPKRNLKRANNSSPFSLLFEIQKKRVDLEAEKLEFEKEKEANKFKLQKLQLEKEERVEIEKLRLEHERLKNTNN